MWSLRIPRMSFRNPHMKMEIVNPQNAGPQIRPICSLDRWNAELMFPSMSPRMTNTIEVVSNERQLAMNSRFLFTPTPSQLKAPKNSQTQDIRPEDQNLPNSPTDSTNAD